MADVFISYKSERRNAALHLKSILELNGYTVWFDYGLLTGRDFARQIEKELTAAKAVVVLWCTRSVQSKWVIDEAYYAQEHGKFIPVWIEQTPLPFGFQRDDTINLTDWDASPRSPDLDRLLDQIAHLVGRDPMPDRMGLRRLEEQWRTFGAPSLAMFALDKDLEAERARRDEEERQRKADDDIRLRAEEDRQRELAEQQRRETEEQARLVAAEKLRLEEENAKAAELLAQKREAELLAQKAEELRLRQQLEAERRIKEDQERRQREAAEQRRIEELAQATKAEAERKSAEALRLVDSARTQSTTVAVEDALAQESTTEIEHVAIPKSDWMSKPAIRYGALAVMILGGGATISNLMGIWGNSTPVPSKPDVSYPGAPSGPAPSTAVDLDFPAGATDFFKTKWENAKKGDQISGATVGILLLTGNNVKRNTEYGRKLLVLSARVVNDHYTRYMLYIAAISYSIPYEDDFSRWYQAYTSDKNNGNLLLAEIYKNGGVYTSENREKADQLFIELNSKSPYPNDDANYALGIYYLYANRPDLNKEKGIDALKIAAKLKHTQAVELLKKLNIKY